MRQKSVTTAMKAVACFSIVASCVFSGDVQILTQHNDSQRTGANLAESILSPSMVSSDQFVLLGRYQVQGKVFAQPLFGSSNGTHKLYVATAANMVYSFDADRPGSEPLRTADLGRDRIVSS